MFVGLQKTTLVNFPGRVAAAVFLPGCNMQCGFCYNAELALAPAHTGISPKDGTSEYANSYVSLEDVYAHLEKRAGVISGLTISGGEPCVSPARDALIRKARSLNLAVKLDTNGLLPNVLETLLADPELCPDMIALDVKTSPSRYPELFFHCASSYNPAAYLQKTLDLLLDTKKHARTVAVEYRTVLVPGLVDKKEIRAIAFLLPPNADWNFAQFQPGTCLDPAQNSIKPYPPSTLEDLVSLARQTVPTARLR